MIGSTHFVFIFFKVPNNTQLSSIITTTLLIFLKNRIIHFHHINPSSLKPSYSAATLISFTYGSNQKQHKGSLIVVVWRFERSFDGFWISFCWVLVSLSRLCFLAKVVRDVTRVQSYGVKFLRSVVPRGILYSCSCFGFDLSSLRYHLSSLFSDSIYTYTCTRW